MDASPLLVLDQTKLFGPSFWQAYNDFYDRKYLTQCFSGGRGSLKSTTIAEFIILGLERDAQEAIQHKRMGDPHWRHYLTHAVCYRKVFGTCRQSVYSQMEWAINKLGLKHKYVCKKTEMKIVRKTAGEEQMILFRGLDDELKSKSIKAPFSFFRYLWFEELAEYSGMEEIRSVCQSVQRGGHQFQTFFSYNPPPSSAHWVNQEMEDLELKDPSFKRYHSTYLSVDPSWSGQEFIDAAERLRMRKPVQYANEYLGLVTGTGGNVFTNVKEVNLSDEDISHFDRIMWGCDFGSSDPTVLIGLNYEKVNNRIILFSEVYERNMMLNRMEDAFKEHYYGHEYIRADCAAKQMIMELEARGLNMLPCRKGPDSILHGIKWLQNLDEILIDRRRCPNAWKEFRNYEYEKVNDMFTSGFPKAPPWGDHAIDSVRYAVEDLSNNAGMF